MSDMSKRMVYLFAVVCFTLSASTLGMAQEWSTAQKEVWKNVEAYWELDSKQDLDGFMSYFHESYRGWGYERGLPGDKASARKSLAATYQSGKRLAYDVQPAAIEIHGSIAFVHYYFSETVKDVQGKAKDYSGRWTDILMKQGDRWVLIGDHGGRVRSD